MSPNRLVTAYDIYATLKDIAHLPNRAGDEAVDEQNPMPTRVDVMRSLLYDIVPRNRSCQEAGS